MFADAAARVIDADGSDGAIARRGTSLQNPSGPGRIAVPSLSPGELPPQTLEAAIMERLGASGALTRQPGKPLRVLHVIARLLPSDGGPPEMLRQLAANYAAIGDTLEVATLDDPKAAYLQECRFPVHAFGPPATTYGFSRGLLWWLRGNVARFDLVIINNVWLFPAVAAWLAATRAGVPYAVFTHGALDVFFKRQYPLKHIKKLLYWPLQYRILRMASAVLFTSEGEREAAQASFRPNRWTSVVVPYGTNRPEGSPETQQEAFFSVLPELRARRFLLFLGRIHEKKGCDLLLEAFANEAAGHPELALVIAGPDQMHLQTKLRVWADRFAVGHRVFWPGMLQGAQKFGAFRAAEAFVLPSHQENFGIAVAEALACGTPVLVSTKVNIWREIVEAGAGLAEPDTLEGTRRLLARWLAMTPVEQAAVAGRAEQVFHERFSLRRSAESIHILAEILKAEAGDDSRLKAAAMLDGTAAASARKRAPL